MTNEKGRLRDISLSRRKFLGSAAIGAAAIGGGAIAASALSPKIASAATIGGSASGSGATSKSATFLPAAPVQIPSTFAYQADVVVVGYGGAGAVTAITAYDAGANVLIIEKTPTLACLGVANTGTVCTSRSGVAVATRTSPAESSSCPTIRSSVGAAGTTTCPTERPRWPCPRHGHRCRSRTGAWLDSDGHPIHPLDNDP